MQNKVRLPGAKFELLDCHRRPIMCVKTNDNGEAFIDCLPLGTYFLRETEAPCGFEKDEKLIELCIEDRDPHKCCEFVNRRKKGSIKIIKYGSDFC